ncbi:MAG: hypothetical protein KIS92_01960 [Planctomycetota bacterium]|nr:hypothetical protein [Planctomycetota bacterium]
MILTVGFAARAFAGEAAPEWVRKLPANVWTKLDQAQSGNRIGARVEWLPNEQKLILIGGLNPKSHRESPKPQKMIYDAATGVWSEYKDQPALPVPALLKIQDATKRLTFSIALDEALASLAGEKIASNSPLEGVAGLGLTILPPMYGESFFLDPIHKEIWVLAGGCGASPEGTLGHWIYSLETNAFRRSPGDPEPLKKLRARVSQVREAQKDAVALARNLFYAAQTSEWKSARVKERLAPAQAEAAQGLAALAAEAEKAALAAGCAPEDAAEAAAALKEAGAKSAEAAQAFAAGKLEAPDIAAAEDASWRADEARDMLASEPPARYRAMGQFDPERKAYVLYGGDHGDYLFNDTWIYDCAKKKWRRVHAPTAPSPRLGGQMFWLPGTKQIALLSGESYLRRMAYQRFTHALSPDVWIFDPANGTWTIAVLPGPEVLERSKDDQPWFIVNNRVVMTQFGVLLCPAVGGNSYHDFMTSSTWMLKLDAAAAKPELTQKHGAPGGKRQYRGACVEAYHPQWYDAAPAAGLSEMEQLIAALPANQWVEVPQAPRPCPERSWGTALYDPERDQMYFWTGGHCADPADIVHHFHPGLNRWSIPYVAGGVNLGIQLTGRPDCQNHTYKNYAYDFVTKKMVAASRAGTSVYDPDRREWSGFSAAQPFPYNSYSSKVVGTPDGVVCWAGGCNDGVQNGIHFARFDAKALTWTPLPVKSGVVPPDVHGDEGGLTWDARRKVVYINAAASYEKPNGKVHRYDPATQEMTVLDPKNRAEIGDKFHRYRETVYLPDADLVLFGMGFVGGRQVAYDPAGNRWVLTSILRQSRKATYDAAKKQWTFDPPKPSEAVGSITFSPVLDTRRNVLWAPSDYKAMFVMKLDPKSLELLEAPPK